MPCQNHPTVDAGLDTCTRCAKTFCIDCLVGRKAGWFCANCDRELGGPATAVAAPSPALAAPQGKTCKNHPEVLDGLNGCAGCGFSFCPDCLVELKGRRFCAGCKVNAVKDIQSGVDGTGLQLAGIGPRFVAHLIDMFVTFGIFGIFMVAFGLIMAVTKPDPNSVVPAMAGCGIYVLVLGGIFGYHAMMLSSKGQTLGKMAMKIKVVTPEGGPISAGQAWIRTLVWFLLQNCWITYIPAFFNKEKMTIHDMAAKTRVVRLD